MFGVAQFFSADKQGQRPGLRTAAIRIASAGLLISAAHLAHAAPAPITLKLFVGGSAQRPDLLRQLLNEYERSHPGIEVELGAGGATSELQRRYLSTLLNAEDSTYDGFMIDIVNPAQYAAAGWIEPLDRYMGSDAAAALKNHLPAYRQADVWRGQLVALPAFSDAMFMYYRKDLLARYGVATPQTWPQLAAAAQKIQHAESQPQLQGLSIQGAPIEGAVCTFLLPYWSAGRSLTDAQGRLTLDVPTAQRGLQQWLDLVGQGVIKPGVAEVKTGDTLNDFKAGKAIFAVNWGFAWNALQNAADSQVKGKVGVMALPAVPGGERVSCMGGWQWALSAFSRHKAETAALLRYLAAPAASRYLALKGSLLPVYASLYQDPQILAQLPWLHDAAPVLQSARARPVTPRYGEVSDVLRMTTSAVLGGSQTPVAGVAEIQNHLQRVLR
ncbi:ABC transporter substrate-binding protein [Silvimonas sp. JCM 19000]